MVNKVQQKQADAIRRIAQNAEAAGITPDQLQKLLSGVKFETGILGRLTPDHVTESFSGAAMMLAQKQDANLQALPAPKTPSEMRESVIEGATTGAAMLDLVRMVFAGKDLAGLPHAAYSESRTPSGPNVDFKLLLEAVPTQLPLAEAKQLIVSLFDDLTAAAKGGQLPLDRGVLATLIHDLQMGMAKRGFSPADAKDLNRKGAELTAVITHPDMKNPDGKIAVLRFIEKSNWEYLSNPFGWGH